MFGAKGKKFKARKEEFSGGSRTTVLVSSAAVLRRGKIPKVQGLQCWFQALQHYKPKHCSVGQRVAALATFPELYKPVAFPGFGGVMLFWRART